MSGELASLLLVLATTEEDAGPHLSGFSRDLLRAMDSYGTLAQAVTALARTLVAEEEELTGTVERCQVARDKLNAELQRVEAQLQQAEKRKSSIEAHKQYCRSALNAIASGKVRALEQRQDSGASATAAAAAAAQNAGTPSGTSQTPAAGGLPASHSVELPSHLTAAPNIQFGTTTAAAAASRRGQGNTSSPAALSTSSSHAQGAPNSAADVVDIEGIVGILCMRDIREGPLMQALSVCESHTSALVNTAFSPTDIDSHVRLIDAVVSNVPHPRPPAQVLELKILSSIAKRCALWPLPGGPRENPLIAALESPSAITCIIRLLHSVNDEVKSEALECLLHLVQSDNAKKCFSEGRGVEPLVSIVASSTNELVLERALVLMWTLISQGDAHSLKTQVRQLGGLRAALDLLYTDSMSILENVAMSVGYITREEESKVAIRDGGGLEKLVATLHHPAESIQTKVAGAIWNCASNSENRVLFRQLGCIPALIELLHEKKEIAHENVAGALWNLSVDADNKTQILDYGGIAALVKVLQTSKSPGVIENVTGTLWNCSAMLENRAAIRKCGGIAPLIGFLRQGNDKVQDNCAGALRNCAINDQNKTAIREAGGVELVFDLLDSVPPATLDKLIALLWILTANPEVRHTVRLCGGIGKLLATLRVAAPQTQEKLIGVLRNCSTEPANRQLMLEQGVVGALVDTIRHGGEAMSAAAKEATASAIWYLSRDDKTTARREGGLQLMCNFLHDSTVAVVEHAAGAISSLTINVAENRDMLREEGGFSKILQLLVANHDVCTSPPGAQPAAPGQQGTSFSYALMNVLLSLRNATSANEANTKIAAEYPGLARALVFIIAKGSEEYGKEAALCVKNLSLVRSCVEELIALGVVNALTSLAERSAVDSVKKAAATALQSVTRYAAALRGARP